MVFSIRLRSGLLLFLIQVVVNHAVVDKLGAAMVCGRGGGSGLMILLHCGEDVVFLVEALKLGAHFFLLGA